MQERENKKAPVTVATVGPLPMYGHGLNGTSPQILQKYDASDYILDKIDYEFYNTQRTHAAMLPMSTPTKKPNTKPVTSGAKKKRKPSRKDRLVLRAQGVEFDTGDETSGADTRRLLRKKMDVQEPVPGKVMSLDLSGGDNDTGLGTASLHEGSDLESPEHKIILGKVDVYSEAEEKQLHPYLDSDVAKQLDAQYKQILKKKSGELLSGRNGTQQTGSDLSSVLTEDLLNKYKQYMVKSASECSFLTKTSKTSGRGGKDVQMSDLDSVRTEDIEGEFRKSMVKTPPSEISQASKLKSQKLKSKSKAKVGATRIPRMTANPLKHKRRRDRKGSGMSDVESVMTEDFENHFHKMMVKQIGGVPITSFDQMIIDSDLDTIKSHVIREKLRIALAGNEEIENNDTEDDYSSEDSTKFNTVIDTHKLQELIKGTSLSAERHPSLESVATLQGSPNMRDYSFSQEHQKHKPAYSNRKAVNRSIPPPIWERDESQLDEEVKLVSDTEKRKEEEIDSTFLSSNSNASLGVDSQGMISKGIEEGTKSFCCIPEERKTMQMFSESTHSISSSFTEDCVTSSQISTDNQSEQAYNGIYVAELNNTDHDAMMHEPTPNITALTGWKDRRQGSVISSTTNSDATGCTFDEVESIDFDLQHDVNLTDLAKSLRSLSKKDLLDLKNFEMDDVPKTNGQARLSSQRGKHNLVHSQLDSELSSDSSVYSDSGRKKNSRLLIEEEEEEEPLPFAKHTFNKRRHHEDSQLTLSGSESEGNEGSKATTKVGLRSVLQRVLSQNRFCQSTSQSSVTSSLSLPYHGYSSEEPSNTQMLPEQPCSGSGSASGADSDDRDASLVPVGDLYDLPSVYSQSTPAENTLMSLGFTSTHSFLPERFARDWQSKIIASKREKYMEELKKHQDTQQPNFVSEKQHENRLHKNKAHNNRKSTSDFVHKLDFNSRTNASSRRARFRRVASVLNCAAPEQKQNAASVMTKDAGKYQVMKEDNVEKQDSLDQLKSLLERQAAILHTGSAKSEKRRRQFMLKKQQSLPLFLDTLNEEEVEGKLGDSGSKGHMYPSSDENQQYHEDVDEKEILEHHKSSNISAFKYVGHKTQHNKKSLNNDMLPSRIIEKPEPQLGETDTPTRSAALENYSVLSRNISNKPGKYQKLFKRSFSMDKQSSVDHESLDSDMTGQHSSSECGASTYASSLSEAHFSEAPASIASSFEMETEDTNDADNQCAVLTQTGNILVASPTTRDHVSLGQTSFGKKNELAPSPLSPRWYSPEFDESPSEEQALASEGPFHSISINTETNSNVSTSLNPKVPAITVSRSSSPGSMRLLSQSSTSLEVAEIMGNRDDTGSFRNPTAPQNNLDQMEFLQTTGMARPNTLQLVPAMVSIVLNDVGRHPTANVHGNTLRLHDSSANHDEDFLRAPSPGNMSNLSSSPAPLSPITVIEMDHLDNQGDSMDSGSGDMALIDNDTRKEEGSICLKISMADILHPISEASDEGGVSTGSRAASFEEVNGECKVVNPCYVHVGVEADDGSLSPIQRLSVNTEDDRESAYSSAIPSEPSTEMQPCSSGSSKSSPVIKSGCNRTSKHPVGMRNRVLEASVQTEEDSLSPIMFQYNGEHHMYGHDQYYVACEKSIQCSIDYHRHNTKDNNSDKSTQTNANLDKSSSFGELAKNCLVLQSRNRTEPYEKFERSFSDFAPQILQSQGMQTDDIFYKGAVPHKDTEVLKSLLCSDCKLRVSERTKKKYFSSPIDRECRHEIVEQEEVSEGIVDIDNKLELDQQNNRKTDSPNDSDDKRENRRSSSRQRGKPKFSPTLLVQEMLDRSISMTDYIERNITMPENLRLDIPEVTFDRSNSVPEYVGGSVSDMIQCHTNVTADEAAMQRRYNIFDNPEQNSQPDEDVHTGSIHVELINNDNRFKLKTADVNVVTRGSINAKDKVGRTQVLHTYTQDNLDKNQIELLESDQKSIVDSNRRSSGVCTNSDGPINNSISNIMDISDQKSKPKKPNINDFMKTMHNIPGLSIFLDDQKHIENSFSNPKPNDSTRDSERVTNYSQGDGKEVCTYYTVEKGGNDNTSAETRQEQIAMDSIHGSSQNETEISNNIFVEATNNEAATFSNKAMLNSYATINNENHLKVGKSNVYNCDLVSVENKMLSSVPSGSSFCVISDNRDFHSRRSTINKNEILQEHNYSKTTVPENLDFNNEFRPFCDGSGKNHSRKRKSMEKVGSWLARSFSVTNSSTTADVFNEDNETDSLTQDLHDQLPGARNKFENEFTTENFSHDLSANGDKGVQQSYTNSSSLCLSSQLDKEKKLLKRMFKKSKRWMKYFDHMDRQRERKFNYNNYETDYSYPRNDIEDMETTSDFRSVNTNIWHHPIQGRIPDFDLDHLLNRIDRIEEMIQTVTTTYSGKTLDFDKVSRQLSKDSDLLNDDINDKRMQIQPLHETLEIPQDVQGASSFDNLEPNLVQPSYQGVSGEEVFCYPFEGVLPKSSGWSSSSVHIGDLMVEEEKGEKGEGSFTLNTATETFTTHDWVRYQEPYQWNPIAASKVESTHDNTEYLLKRLKDIEESIAMENERSFDNNTITMNTSELMDVEQKNISQVEKAELCPHFYQRGGTSMFIDMNRPSRSEIRNRSPQQNGSLIKQAHIIDETRF